MKPAANKSKASVVSTLMPRPALQEPIRRVFKARQHLVLSGRPGSGRRSLVRLALPSVRQVELDCLLLWTKAAVDQAFAAQGGLREMVEQLDQQARRSPICMVLLNIDGCRGQPKESEIMGWLRSIVQRCQHLGWVFTVSDKGFLERHFANAQGPFFKQVAVHEIPPFTQDEAEQLVLKQLGGFIDSAALRALVDSAGLIPRDLALLIAGLRAVRGPQGTGNVSLPQVEAAAAGVVESRRGLYENLLFSQMNDRQRRVLHAIAGGMPVAASKDSVAITGVAKGSLKAVFQSLAANGWLLSLEGDWIFSDPFLRCFLRDQDGVKSDA